MGGLLDLPSPVHVNAAPGVNSALLGGSQPQAGTGMMAGVEGFDPSDPGAYGGRTAGDADMAGYGGSPRLPDASSKSDFGGLISGGLDLMAAGSPQQPSWMASLPPPPQAHWPDPAAMAALLQEQRRRFRM